MEAAVFKTIHPKEYYRKFFEQNVRPDGRDLLGVRDLIVLKGVNRHAHGSSIVRLGNTTVSCNVLGEFSTPLEETPKAGYFVPTVSMSQASSIGTQFQTSNEKTNTLHQFISDIFQRGKYLPLDQLCVVEGEIAWTLYAEINILEFDGGLETASLLALVAALQNVLLPAYEADTEAGEMVPTEADATKLDMTGVPFALGFSLFDDSLVTDLTMEEEVLMDSRVCVVVDSSENIVRVDKIGGRPLSSDRLRSVVHTTKRNLNGVLETLAAA